MVETGLGLAALATAVVTQDTLKKLLGPSADMLGEGVRDIFAERLSVLKKVIANANQKVGDQIDSPGKVPMRVMKEVLDEGSLSDDLITVDYFGGVLASSRTPIGRDDRGGRIAKLIGRMTAYQMRAHYVLYSAVRRIHSNKERTLKDGPGRSMMTTFVSYNDFMASMDYTPDEMVTLSSHFSGTMHGLSDEGLVQANWVSGSADQNRKVFKNTPELDGLIFCPTISGSQLFLWAFGKGSEDPDFLLDEAFEADISGVVLSLNDTQQVRV